MIQSHAFGEVSSLNYIIYWEIMKNMNTNMYEMMVIMKPLLPDDVRKVLHKAIVDLCKKLEGEVKEVDVWGKRYLAYPISSHNEGYYLVYSFSLPSKSMKEFKRVLDLKQEILRYLLLKAEGDFVKEPGVGKKEIEVNI